MFCTLRVAVTRLHRPPSSKRKVSLHFKQRNGNFENHSQPVQGHTAVLKLRKSVGQLQLVAFPVFFVVQTSPHKMKVILFFVCAFGVQAAPLYVWDIIKAPLRTDQVFDIISNAVPGQSFPIYASIPQSNFDCSKQKFPGYYADVSTQCQVFYR